MIFQVHSLADGTAYHLTKDSVRGLQLLVFFCSFCLDFVDVLWRSHSTLVRDLQYASDNHAVLELRQMCVETDGIDPGLSNTLERHDGSCGRQCRYRHTSYHKQTKNQWARDDPAFFVVTCFLLTVASLAYCIACGSPLLCPCSAHHTRATDAAKLGN